MKLSTTSQKKKKISRHNIYIISPIVFTSDPQLKMNYATLILRDKSLILQLLLSGTRKNCGGRILQTAFKDASKLRSKAEKKKRGPKPDSASAKLSGGNPPGRKPGEKRPKLSHPGSGASP